MRKKMLMVLVSAVLTLFLFALPIIAIGSIVAVPVKAISELFNNIEDFMFGDGSTDADELVVLIQMSISNTETQTKIKNTYSGKLKYHDVDVPEHYVVVIQMLSGIEFEDVTDDLIQSMLESAVSVENTEDTGEAKYKLATVEIYAESIMKKVPFNESLSKIPSSTLAEIITKVGSINSGSGLSPELIEKYKGKLMYPFSNLYPVGDGVGTYYPNGVAEEHSGLDLRAPCGTPVYAMDDGVVQVTEANNKWRGNYIIWTNGEMEYRYLHFRDPLTLYAGDKVSKGQYIGSVGNTGYSFGCHLHLETRVNEQVIDPRNFLEVYNPDFNV